MTDHPVFPQTILDLLRENGDRTVFEHGARLVTAGETLDTIRRIAAGLRTAGIGPGVGVAMLTGVSPEGFAAMIAAYALGARVAGVRPGLTAGQLGHLLGEQVSAVVLDPSTATAEVRAVAGGTALLSLGAVPAATDLLAGGDDGVPLAPAGRPDDIARITYTSGSTGNPKGCAQTYRAIGVDWPTRPDRWPPAIRQLAAGLDRYLLFGTLSSQVALDYALLSLFGGGTVVIPDDPQPRPFFPAAIARYRITGSIMSVPRLYQMLDALRADPLDLSGLRALMVSGSPIDPRRLAEALERLGPVVYQGYGQSEVGLLTMLTPREALGSAQALASVGRPNPTTRISIRDTDGAPVPPGATGELFVRTPYQTVGYWANPGETAEVYADGWVRTRDLGHLDDDGYLHLVGRTREVVIVNANVYYAGPIERALAAHPDVDQAYVVGALDEETGEAVHAFVVPRGAGRPDAGELRDLVRARLGEACVPKTVTVISEVPLTATGKPDKRALIPPAAATDRPGERALTSPVAGPTAAAP